MEIFVLWGLPKLGDSHFVFYMVGESFHSIVKISEKLDDSISKEEFKKLLDDSEKIIEDIKNNISFYG